MSLRGIVSRVTLVLLGLALVSVAGLAVTTTLMHQATTRLSEATAGLRAASGIEVNLLAHNVHAYLWLATGDPVRRELRDAAAARLDGWFALAREHAVSVEERQVIDEAEGAVRAHVANWDAIEADAVPPLEGYRRALASLAPATTVADRLLELNEAQAAEALAVSRRLNEATDLAALALALALGAVAIAGAVVIRRSIYLPLVGLRGAMARFAAGDLDARADTGGPDELAEAARDFNSLADRLERQRADRLAFIAAVAHDLKNPLSALKTAAAFLNRAGDDAARERRASLIRRQVDRMNRMLGDFLDISRIEAGRLELRPEPVDVAGVARNVTELFGAAAERHEVVVSAPPEPVVIEADPARLEQVFDNLISNAIKYSPEGGRVDVRVGRRNGSAVIEVEDHGIGIAPADRERIFEPFKRLQTRADLPGVGLGLSVTRKLVEGHGGRIAVESVPGRGSTFRVELPVAGHA